MNKSAAPQRDTGNTESQQSLPGWAEAQDSLASALGLSLLLVDGHQPPALQVSNNNSICQAFQSSPAHAQLCAPFCGEAFTRAQDAGEASRYRCHAGLHCVAMPVQLTKERQLAVIGGRAFLTSADYRALAERFRVGDLQDLLSSDLFSNVIFAARQDLEDLAARISLTASDYEKGLLTTDPAAAPEREARAEVAAAAQEFSGFMPEGNEKLKSTANARPGGANELSNHYFPPNANLTEACGSAFQLFADKHEIKSLALLLHDKNVFSPAYIIGRFREIPMRIEAWPRASKLAVMARAGASLALDETAEGFKPVRAVTLQGHSERKAIAAELFPLVIGDEVKGALVVGDTLLNDAKRQAISNFCRDIALPLEVLHLRNELEQRARFADYLQTFTERINAVEPAEIYQSILLHSAELLRAERGSLLLLDEASNELAVKAAVGLHAEAASEARMRLGDGVSGAVLQEGRPLVVRDLELAGHTPAPAERRYKTKSFISYPIILNGRKVGVLNITDKTDGGSYDEVDLNLLETIAPQMALALDRAEWQEKATQFQLMSITDPLTGLLNRRYLIERLSEELKRSERQNYAMSFMMVDIDDFKLYNDLNGHQAGDSALEITAQCLRSALRSADVAARYGGEEFCILLPQTALPEALAIAERIRRKVERARYPHGKTQPLGSVTVSLGVSEFSPVFNTAEMIIGAADRALYLAKNHGKNRVQVPETEQSGTASSSDVEKQRQ